MSDITFKVIEAMSLGLSIGSRGINKDTMLEKMGENIFRNFLNNYIKRKRKELQELSQKISPKIVYKTDYADLNIEPADNIAEELEYENIKREFNDIQSELTLRYFRIDFDRCTRYISKHLEIAAGPNRIENKEKESFNQAYNLIKRAENDLRVAKFIVPKSPKYNKILTECPEFIERKNKINFMKNLYILLVENPETGHLKFKLEDAINKEQYKKAAKLKDIIEKKTQPSITDLKSKIQYFQKI